MVSPIARGTNRLLLKPVSGVDSLASTAKILILSDNLYFLPYARKSKSKTVTWLSCCWSSPFDPLKDENTGVSRLHWFTPLPSLTVRAAGKHLKCITALKAAMSVIKWCSSTIRHQKVWTGVFLVLRNTCCHICRRRCFSVKYALNELASTGAWRLSAWNFQSYRVARASLAVVRCG